MPGPADPGRVGAASYRLFDINAEPGRRQAASDDAAQCTRRALRVEFARPSEAAEGERHGGAAQAAVMSASRREWAICAAPVVTDRRETTGIQRPKPTAYSSRVIKVRLRRLPPLNQFAPVRIQQLRRED
jgi:hypothetical protein